MPERSPSATSSWVALRSAKPVDAAAGRSDNQDRLRSGCDRSVWGGAAADVRGRLEIARRSMAPRSSPAPIARFRVGQRPRRSDAGPAGPGPARRAAMCCARCSRRRTLPPHTIIRTLSKNSRADLPVPTIRVVGGMPFPSARQYAGRSQPPASSQRPSAEAAGGRGPRVARACPCRLRARASRPSCRQSSRGCGSTSNPPRSRSPPPRTPRRPRPPPRLRRSLRQPVRRNAAAPPACRGSWPPWNTRRPPRRSRSIRIRPSFWHARSRSIRPPKP